MSTEYQLTKRGRFHDYSEFYINIESSNKKFMDFMDKELDSILKKINGVY